MLGPSVRYGTVLKSDPACGNMRPALLQYVLYAPDVLYLPTEMHVCFYGEIFRAKKTIADRATRRGARASQSVSQSVRDD